MISIVSLHVSTRRIYTDLYIYLYMLYHVVSCCWSFGAEENIVSETWKPFQSVVILACWKHSLSFVIFRFFLPPLKAHMSDRVSMLALSAETELVAERQHDVLASLKNSFFKWVPLNPASRGRARCSRSLLSESQPRTWRPLRCCLACTLTCGKVMLAISISLCYYLSQPYTVMICNDWMYMISCDITWS